MNKYQEILENKCDNGMTLRKIANKITNEITIYSEVSNNRESLEIETPSNIREALSDIVYGCLLSIRSGYNFDGAINTAEFIGMITVNRMLAETEEYKDYEIQSYLSIYCPIAKVCRE